MDFLIVDPSKNKRKRTIGLCDFETICIEDSKYTIETTETTEDQKAIEPIEDSESSDSSETDEVVPICVHYNAQSFYSTFVARTSEQCHVELTAPQRSIEWLNARKHAITASNFGAALGHNKYMSPKALVLDKLWNVFKGNEFTAYGTFHEKDAAASFVMGLDGPLRPTIEDLYRRKFGTLLDSFEVLELGLVKSHLRPWLAVSPDGILRLDGPSGPMFTLVEYKCPARLRDSMSHPYKTSPYNIPEYYMDQIQGIMGLFYDFPGLAGIQQIDYCFFVVWQPKQYFVTLVPFNNLEYALSMVPSLTSWYFKQYLPLAVLKENGLLIHGTDTAATEINISAL